MSDVKTWAEIDASPLLHLPPEERAQLQQSHDERFRAFWADCFQAMLASRKGSDEEMAVDSFCDAFLDVFAGWTPKDNQTFSVYLRSAVKHQRAHMILESETTGFGRETNRRIKKALEYMEKNGITETMLSHSKEKAQAVAESAHVGTKTLLEALRNRQSVLSLDAPGDGDSVLGDYVEDPRENVEQQAEWTGEFLQWMHQGLGLLSLAEKENFGKENGVLWSSGLMGHLRNYDVVPPADDARSRLDNCDDLRPLERDNCLWDVLLLRSYVAFTVRPPYTPDELEHAALNELQRPDRNPAMDKTVAEFEGVSKSAISQRRKRMRAKLEEQ